MNDWSSRLSLGEGSKSPECGGVSIALCGPEHECGHAIVMLATGWEFEFIDSCEVSNPVKGQTDNPTVVLVAGMVAHARALDPGLSDDWWSLLQTQHQEDGDLMQIALLLGREVPEIAREDLLPYVRQAESILDKHREQFLQLVARLRQTGRVNYREAKAIFDGNTLSSSP